MRAAGIRDYLSDKDKYVKMKQFGMREEKYGNHFKGDAGESV